MYQKSILILFLVFFSKCSFADYGWAIAGTAGSSVLTSIYFVNPSTGYIGGCYPGKILKSTNDGANWAEVYSGTDTEAVYDIFFTNDNTGYAVGANDYWPVKSRTLCLKTINGGNSWTVNPAHFEGSLNSVKFANPNTGYAVGSAGCIIKTTDAGETWVKLTPQTDFSNYVCLQVFSSQNVMVTSFFGSVRRTTDGGKSWVDSYFNSEMASVSFTNSLTGYIAGGENIIMTTDGGSTWNTIQTLYNIDLRCVVFTNANTGYVCERNIYQTTNAGLTWQVQFIPTNYVTYTAMSFVNNDTGYAVGSSGVILKTVTGGLNPVHQVGNTMPKEFTLYQNFPNPFNPTTMIRFPLPKSSFAKLILYDVLGRTLETLINGQLNAGNYEEEWNGDKYSSGVYYYKLTSGDFTETRKMILIK